MKKQKYLLFFRRVDIIIGKPIPYSELGFENGGSEEYRLATDKIFNEIVKLGGYDKLLAASESEK